MKQLALKLLNTTIWNVGASGINFISNYFIVTWLSLSIFGEFAVYSSYVAMGTLIFSIIPSNYAIFKYQDDEKFKKHLAVFFFIALILFSCYLFLLNIFGLVYVSLISSLMYSLPLGIQAFFDISYQATNRLSQYFFILFIIAISKLFVLFIARQYDLLVDFESLLIYSSWSYIIIVLILLFLNRKHFKLNLIDFKSFFYFYLDNQKSFIPYYFNTFIKRIRENIIIFLFKPFVSLDILGIFSLFVKLDQFVFGISRNIEAFFMSRNNLEKHKESFDNFSFTYSMILQLVYVFVGVIYMATMTNQSYYIQVIIQSFLIYPQTKFLMMRASLLSKYNNLEVNLSEISFIAVVGVILFICSFFNLYTVTSVLLTYFFAKLGSQLFLIFNNYSNNKFLNFNK